MYRVSVRERHAHTALQKHDNFHLYAYVNEAILVLPLPIPSSYETLSNSGRTAEEQRSHSTMGPYLPYALS